MRNQKVDPVGISMLDQSTLKAQTWWQQQGGGVLKVAAGSGQSVCLNSSPLSCFMPSCPDNGEKLSWTRAAGRGLPNARVLPCLLSKGHLPIWCLSGSHITQMFSLWAGSFSIVFFILGEAGIQIWDWRDPPLLWANPLRGPWAVRTLGKAPRLPRLLSAS